VSISRTKGVFFLLAVVCLVSSCGHKNSSPVISANGEGTPRLVAVLPVENETSDAQAALILRGKIFEELYFKGYPKIPFEIIDEKLSQIYRDARGCVAGKIPPVVVGKLLGVDAVMYCTLTERKTSFVYFYAPTIVSASFELRSAKTGETLWKSHHRVIKRNYGFSRRWLEMKACQVYETVVDEVVEKSLETLPDGPDSV
jgi:Uncharacterized protein conserved in bacteria